MFNPKTIRIKELSALHAETIKTLEGIFDGPSNLYIDWANVLHWQDRVAWHFDIRRMKQFFDSFEDIKSIKIYTGTLLGNKKSEDAVREMRSMGYDVTTKPVKIIKISIDTSSASLDSPSLLKQFIKKSLLDRLDSNSVVTLNRNLAKLNKAGQFYIEDLKCNFDVELGRDLLRDFESNKIKNFVLWSVDSDFSSPLEQMKCNDKKVVIFAISGQVSAELYSTGNYIFDVKKIKEFLCWSREMPKR